MQKEGVVPVLAHISGPGEAYLTEQASAIKQRFGVRMGKSPLMRGICDGFAQAGFDLSDSPTAFHVASKVAAALRGAK
jgi:hypothetical protein